MNNTNNTVKTVIYNQNGNKGASAQITFNKEACQVAGINIEEYEVEKLMINPNPSRGSWDAGWSANPEIQFTSGRVISQIYSCSKGQFKLFDYQIV